MPENLQEFVVAKAKNMRLMLEPFIKTEEHKTLLTEYNETKVMELTHKYLAPLYATNTLQIASAKLIEELSIEDPVVKDKIGRYLLCFCESMLVK